MLNIAGSFATAQLRKIFNLSGAAQPSASEDIQLVQAIDPERLQPYGQWRRAAFGYTEDTTLAQPYSFGIINPAASNTICVIESARAHVNATLPVISAITDQHDVANGNFIAVDDTDPTSTIVPIQWFRNQNRASSGTIIGASLGGTNLSLPLIEHPYPLYPNHEINWGFAPAAPVTVAYRFVIRWISPKP